MSRNERLYRARLKMRWSQEKAAENAKISRKTYIELEIGKRTPQISTLDLLCAAFHASPHELGYNSIGQPLTEGSIALPDSIGPSQSNDVISFTREQAEWVAHLLHTGENAMKFDPSKRATLLKVLESAGIVLVAPYLRDTETRDQ
jgi:transcriptional regulator with XRE-family HTH domain